MSQAEETEFGREVEDAVRAGLEAEGLDADQQLRIAVVGRVSAGKSSLINAIFDCPRDKPIAEVGALSGKTTGVTAYSLTNCVHVIDTPGLEDIIAEHSKVTQDFLEHGIDAAIFVVSGSADAGQRASFELAKKHARAVVLVLNKADAWDDHKPTTIEEVKDQWCQQLGADKIFATVCKGYDPDYSPERNLDLRGVNEVQNEIRRILRGVKKEWEFLAAQRNKRKVAIGIIVSAVVSAAGASFVPGGAVLISGIQAVAAAGLTYIYTGVRLSATSAVSLVVGAMGRAVGLNAFLWIKQLLPPTGVIDLAAATVAATVTAALLVATAILLERGVSSLTGAGVGDQAQILRKRIAERVAKASFDDLKSPAFWIDIVTELFATPDGQAAPRS